MFKVLLLCVLLLLEVRFSESVGKERKSVRKRTNQAGNHDHPSSAVQRTLQEWHRISKEALDLACMSLNLLRTGSRETLAQRLFDHYRNQQHPPIVETRNGREVAGVSNEQNIDLEVADGNDQNRENTVNNHDIQTLIRQEMANFMTDWQRQQQQQHAIPNISQQPNVNFGQFMDPVIAALPNQNIDFVPPVTSIRNAMATESASEVVRMARNSTTTNNSQSYNTAALPPLSAAILQQIQQRKFVNFDLILPTTNPKTIDSYSIKLDSNGDTPSIALVPSSQNRGKVTDFHSWCIAWSTYLQAMSVYHPRPHTCRQCQCTTLNYYRT